jgi:hypothetical protein
MSPATDEKRGGLGPIERAVRIVGGGLVVIIGLNLWLAGAGLIAWAWFGAALLGVDFIVTGVRGYCPLYARLGIGRLRIDARTSRAIRGIE